MERWMNIACGAVAACFSAVAGVCDAGAGTSPRIAIESDAWRTFSGSYWGGKEGQPVLALLRSADGAEKGRCRAQVNGGAWRCSVGWNTDVVAGDSVEVLIGLVSQGSAVVPPLAARRIAPASDVVAGRTSPGETVKVELGDSVYTASDQTYRSYAASVVADARGRFALDSSGHHDIVRGTEVTLRVVRGVYTFSKDFRSPGIQTYVGSSWCEIDTLRPGAYTVALLSRKGIPRAVDFVEVGGGESFGEARFRNRRGDVAIRPGDRIVVSGPTDLAVRVPPMSLGADTTTMTLSGRTLPETAVRVEAVTYDDAGSGHGYHGHAVTDARGDFTVSFAPAVLRDGDLMYLKLRDPRGSFFQNMLQILPGR